MADLTFTCTPRLHVYNIASDGQSARCICGEREWTVALPPPWAESVAHIVSPSEWCGRLEEWSGEPVTEYYAKVSDEPHVGCDFAWEYDGVGEIRLTTGPMEIRCEADDEDLPAVMAGMVAAVAAFNIKHAEVTDG